MFHLLVKYQAWALASDELSSDRVFEYTEPELVDWFKPTGVLDATRLLSHPALMITEIGGQGTQTARICNLRSVAEANGSVRVQYAPIESLPQYSNSALRDVAPSLGIEDFEFRRSHWAVKRADLFKVLLQERAAPALAPKLFNLSDPSSPSRHRVSAMMPFDKTFDEVYNAIDSAARAEGLECFRADNFWKNDAIIQDIVELLCTSSIVICDCTGKNPNVFYEVGIAHTLGREVILITQNESDIPFDIRHVRYVRYLNNAEGRSHLESALRMRIRTVHAAK